MTTLTVNGREHEIVPAGRTLLEILRDDLGLKGAKLGCGEGECGACTVLLDGQAVCACLLTADQAEGRTVLTVEAVAKTALGREITQALTETGAVQCGFCTPGFVMAATAHFSTSRQEDLDTALEGNLCRCTGYTKIRQALAGVPPHRGRKPKPVSRISLETAIAGLADDPDLIPIAGGTDLLVKWEHKLDEQRFLDLTRVGDEELNGISPESAGISIGALVTWSRILTDRRVAKTVPILAAVARELGGTQIRNAATIGGNLVTASPAGDSLPALCALHARLNIVSSKGRRTLTANDFLVGPGQTTLEKGELVTSIFIPEDRFGLTQSFRKVGPRRAQSIAKLSLALIGKKHGGRWTDLSMAFGAVGPVPMRCPDTTALLVGSELSPDLYPEVARTLKREIAPITDHRSTREYRHKIAGRILWDALTR